MALIVTDKMWRQFVFIAAFLVIKFTVLSGTANLLNVTIESSPKLGYETVCVDESVNLTCLTDQVAIITWYWLDQSKSGHFISTQVTLSDVVYTCKACLNDGQMGEVNITVAANGED